MRVLAAVLLLCVHAGAQIDLTPRKLARDLEGFRLYDLAFSDGPRSITYQPPDGWTYSGGKDKLTLEPHSQDSAIAAIEAFPRPLPKELDEKTLDSLTNEILETVPHGSTDVALVARGPGSIAMDRHSIYEIMITYTVGGRAFLRSTVFLNLDQTHVRFQLVAAKSEFKSLHNAFQRSLCTWQWNEQ